MRSVNGPAPQQFCKSSSLILTLLIVFIRPINLGFLIAGSVKPKKHFVLSKGKRLVLIGLSSIQSLVSAIPCPVNWDSFDHEIVMHRWSRQTTVKIIFLVFEKLRMRSYYSRWIVQSIRPPMWDDVLHSDVQVVSIPAKGVNRPS
jgi:hypothetical protein